LIPQRWDRRGRDRGAVDVNKAFRASTILDHPDPFPTAVLATAHDIPLAGPRWTAALRTQCVNPTHLERAIIADLALPSTK
jgi:hypothetical protein